MQFGFNVIYYQTCVETAHINDISVCLINGAEQVFQKNADGRSSHWRSLPSQTHPVSRCGVLNVSLRFSKAVHLCSRLPVHSLSVCPPGCDGGGWNPGFIGH